MGYCQRGNLNYDSYALKDALNDFRKVVELVPKDDYSRFRVWLIQSRSGETEVATSELRTYLANCTAGQSDDWPSKIGQFLVGQITEAEFLAAATNTGINMEPGRLCEAYFYAGSKHLLTSDKVTATDYFQKSMATNKKDLCEYNSAAVEFQFLKAEAK